MGMVGIVCSLSKQRRSLLEADPHLLEDAIAARRRERIPGLLDLGKAWHALDLILGGGDDALLGDAVMARSGQPFGPTLGYGPPRLLEPARVALVADALEALPVDRVEDGYPLLTGAHGGFGPKVRPPSTPNDYDAEIAALGLDDEPDPEEAAERDELAVALQRLTDLYRAAADRGDAVIAVIV